MSIASNASFSLRHVSLFVFTTRDRIKGIPFVRAPSPQLRSTSSKHTHVATSGFCCSQVPISRARRSANAIVLFAFRSSRFGFKVVVVQALICGNPWLLKVTPIAFLIISVRRHSDDNTMLAPVCKTIVLSALSATLFHDMSSTFGKTGTKSPSTSTRSVSPSGFKTPSISRKITLVLSSFGRGLCSKDCVTATTSVSAGFGRKS
mmetsp:Transcript_106108/g.167567  ORF Transcript_106108/g.167567 Transcript_106108/m.167567 type:complete len:205 (-) Transcript_106108:78-692(-)